MASSPMIGPYSGYGNYIRIKHNATYATAYGHISRFAGGLHAGSRVQSGPGDRLCRHDRPGDRARICISRC